MKVIEIKDAYNLYKKHDSSGMKFIEFLSDKECNQVIFKYGKQYYTFFINKMFSTLDTVESLDVPIYEHQFDNKYHVYVTPVKKVKNKGIVTSYVEL